MFKSFDFGPLVARGAAGVLLTLSLLGCKRQDVTVYEVPKETPDSASSSAAASNASDPHAGMAMAMPTIKWTKLPEGWAVNPGPGPMRTASFLITGKDDQQAELGVIPISGMAGVGDLQLVNMWRGQVKLPAIEEGDVTNQSASVDIGEEQGRLFEMASTEPVIDDKQKGRILVAVLNKDGTSWFFKLAGEDSFVASQKEPLIEFLKGVSFEAAPQLPPGHPTVAGGMGMGQGAMGGGMAAMGGGDTVPADSSDHPEWQAPENWKALAHSPFLVAKFEATGEGGAKADINVSTSGGMGGGLLPNVNRWRGQLSLGAVDQAELDKLVSTLDLPAAKATLVDFSGSGSENGDKVRCVAVMVPLGDETWFFKIMGSEPVVAREKEDFVKFVRSVKFPHAP